MSVTLSTARGDPTSHPGRARTILVPSPPGSGPTGHPAPGDTGRRIAIERRGCGGEPVRVRRLIDREGQRLQQIVCRGSTSSVRYWREMMLPASAGGNRGLAIVQLVQADEDTARDVIHRFNEIGLACLDPPARSVRR